MALWTHNFQVHSTARARLAMKKWVGTVKTSMSVTERSVLVRARSVSTHHPATSVPASSVTVEKTALYKLNRVCMKHGGGFCHCPTSRVSCEFPPAGTFIDVEQVFLLAYDTDWADENSLARAQFDQAMRAALAPLYNSADGFEGVNINNVTATPSTETNGRKKRAVTEWVAASPLLAEWTTAMCCVKHFHLFLVQTRPLSTRQCSPHRWILRTWCTGR